MSRITATCAVLVAAAVLVTTTVACGASDQSYIADVASCSIARSEFGPLSADTALGSSMDREAARTLMDRDDIAEWIAVTAAGPWDDAWQTATQRLGGGIHADLSWLDLNGEILDLFEPGDAYDFVDLRVSRSFQGKLEHNRGELWLPVHDDGRTVNDGAACVITAVEVGDEASEVLTDIIDDVPVASR